MDKGLGYPTLLDGLKPAGPKSNVELRASAVGGFGPRGSKSRKSNNPFTSPILSGSGYGVRPGHQKCPAAGPTTLRVAEALPHSRKFVLGASPSSRCLRALRLGSLYPNKRTAIPLGIALLALSL